MTASQFARPWTRRMSSLGAGQVFHQRVLPAALELAADGYLHELNVFDLKAESQFRFRSTESLAIRYHQLNGDDLIPQMQQAGALGNDTLGVVLTPSRLHVDNGCALLGQVWCAAIEKPMGLDPVKACRMREFADHVALIDHQLYKPEMLSLVADARSGRLPWSEIQGVEFRLCEIPGVGDRQVDDAIFDLAYHGLACMLVPLRTSLFDVSIRIDRSQTSTYQGGPDKPGAFTAARVQGRFIATEIESPFVISVGKGLKNRQKGLRLCGGRGTIRRVRLNESGHFAHLRFFRSLLDPNDTIGRLIDVNDSIKIVQACADAVAIAESMPPYQFGSTPTWLTRESGFAHQNSNVDLVRDVPGGMSQRRGYGYATMFNVRPSP